MGRRFTGAEREQIGKLVSEGLTSREIAERLSRTEAAIRNIRHREHLKTVTSEQLPSLTRDRDRLSREIVQLTQRHNFISANLRGLETRGEDLSKALQIDENTLQIRLTKALIVIKEKRPELFYISREEQLTKITGELLDSLLKYLIA